MAKLPAPVIQKTTLTPASTNVETIMSAPDVLAFCAEVLIFYLLRK